MKPKSHRFWCENCRINIQSGRELIACKLCGSAFSEPINKRRRRTAERMFARAAVCNKCEHWGDHPCADGEVRTGCGLLKMPCRIHDLRMKADFTGPSGRECWPADDGTITTRNLIYHVCPIGDWRENVDRLIQHQTAFNGKRVIAIVEGDGLESVDVAREYVAPLGAKIIIMPNDRELREVVTFLPLLLSVASTDSTEATFYAHTKGNTTSDSKEGARLWREVMYAELIGKWEACMDHLRDFKFVGTHKMIWLADQPSPFPTRLKPTYPWMHCGTFWWFRHDAVFSHPEWRRIHMERYGAEAWPASMYPHHDAKSMWQPWPEDESAWPQRNPYDPGLYHEMGFYG